MWAILSKPAACDTLFPPIHRALANSNRFAVMANCKLHFFHRVSHCVVISSNNRIRIVAGESQSTISIKRKSIILLEILKVIFFYFSLKVFVSIFFVKRQLTALWIL